MNGTSILPCPKRRKYEKTLFIIARGINLLINVNESSCKIIQAKIESVQGQGELNYKNSR